MTPKPATDEDDVVDCDVCFKEIPISEAKSEEASDYVHHFCGLECFARWRVQEGVEPLETARGYTAAE